jgi:hypothetical protein
MALPTSYLTSAKNLSGILNSIVGAQAPDKFTTRFLESLDYKSNSDRLVIGLLKSLGFLADDGRPTQRYFDYLDQTQSQAVLAQAIREAYADLFQVNKNANQMSKTEVVNKFKTLAQGQYSESVLDKMGMTFMALCTLADFGAAPSPQESAPTTAAPPTEPPSRPAELEQARGKGLSISGLVYNIQLILPESRDARVYDALFDSLKRHLS